MRRGTRQQGPGQRLCFWNGVWVVAFWAVSLLGLRLPAAGADPIIELNQARASAGGVTPEDTPGFPISLSRPGAYALTGKLTVEDPDTTAISISASYVTLDLRGFAIIGPTECSGGPLDCNPVGASDGVAASSPSISKTSVLNGTVRGVGDTGLRLGIGARVEGVHVIGNGRAGILVAASGAVSDNTVQGNGDEGILAHSGSMVTRNTVRGNGDNGIRVTGNSAVSDNTVRNNGGSGILAGAGSTITGNTVQSNMGLGLALSEDVDYADNVLTLNNGGNSSRQVWGGTQTGTNQCGTRPSCP